MSSRQQVLFLLQKTQKEANWDMENDSDFIEEGMVAHKYKDSTNILLDYSQETYPNEKDMMGSESVSIKRMANSYYLPSNEEFEIKREKMVSIHESYFVNFSCL